MIAIAERALAWAAKRRVAALPLPAVSTAPIVAQASHAPPEPLVGAPVVKVHHGAQDSESACRKAWIGEFGSRGTEDPAEVTCEGCRVVLRKRGLLKIVPDEPRRAADVGAASVPTQPTGGGTGVDSPSPRCIQGPAKDPDAGHDPESFRVDPRASNERVLAPRRKPSARKGRPAEDRPLPVREDLAAEIAEEESSKPRRRGRRKQIAGGPKPRQKLTYKNIEGEQELELIRRYKAGDRNAGEILLRAHEPLIYSMAKRYFGKGCDIEDLLQEARLGFLHAAERFDETKGFRLVTYAAWWARERPGRYLQDHRADIRIPVHIQETIGAARRTGAITPEEIAGMNRKGAARAALALETARRPLSLDAPVQDMDGKTISDTIADDAPLPDERIIGADTESKRIFMVDGMLERLSHREREVVRLRYLADEPLTLREIGDRFGVSHERIRQIEAKALATLRSGVEEAEDIKPPPPARADLFRPVVHAEPFRPQLSRRGPGAPTGSRPRTLELEQEVLRRRAAGEKLQMIADDIGLTKARIQQLEMQAKRRQGGVLADACA